MAYTPLLDIVLRIILIGNTESGKSRTGATLLGSHREFDTTSPTKVSTKKSAHRFNQRFVVVDTPGPRNLPNQRFIEELNTSIDLCSPGPHIFLFCISMARYTDNVHNMKKTFFDILGDNASDFIIFVFTKFDQWIEDMNDKGYSNPNFEMYLSSLPQEMREFMDSCGNVYVKIDNNVPNTANQANEILSTVNDAVKKNGFKYFKKTRFRRIKYTCCRILHGFCWLCRQIFTLCANGLRRIFHYFT